MKAPRSLLAEAEQIQLARELIDLDARLQVLESEVHLSRERLLRLYREMKGKSPPKGMLPFSTDWFMTWQPNIHSSLFMNLFRHQMQQPGVSRVRALISGFRVYRETTERMGLPELLSLTRAWRLVKFFDADMLSMTRCTECGGHFVTHAYEPSAHYVCGLCHMPSRAGKGRAGLSLTA